VRYGLKAESLLSTSRQRDHLPRWRTADAGEMRSMRTRDVVGVPRWRHLAWLLVALLMPGRFVAVGQAAAQSGPQSRLNAEGVAHVVATEVPASKFMSAEARTASSLPHC
jgi:hypothetical protein